MTLEQLGSLGELIGGVAVIVSLVYLAVQIRQNTQSVRASAYRGVIDGLNEGASLIAQDSTLADIYQRGCQNIDDLSAHEEVQFRNLIVLATSGGAHFLEHYDDFFNDHLHEWIQPHPSSEVSLYFKRPS